jgi:prepilin-type N-terminal cleavage/methylation domain-containing protein
MKRIRSRIGYTLTELMLVVAILGIVMSVGPLMLTQLQNFYLMTTARNDIERDARSSLDILNRMIRQAVKDTIVIDTNGQGPLSRIRFRHVDGRYMEFRQNGSKLEMLVQPVAGGAVNTSVLTNNLVYIAFSFPRSDDPTVISVSITMGKSIQLGRVKVLELTIQKVRVMN